MMPTLGGIEATVRWHGSKGETAAGTAMQGGGQLQVGTR